MLKLLTIACIGIFALIAEISIFCGEKVKTSMLADHIYQSTANTYAVIVTAGMMMTLMFVAGSIGYALCLLIRIVRTRHAARSTS